VLETEIAGRAEHEPARAAHNIEARAVGDLDAGDVVDDDDPDRQVLLAQARQRSVEQVARDVVAQIPGATTR